MPAPHWLTPGRCCVNCPNCRCSADSASMAGCGPRQWQVEIIGLANLSPADCATCDNLNGSYVLDWTGIDPWGNCTWAYAFPSAVCNVLKLTLWVGPGRVWSGGINWPIAVYLLGADDYTLFWQEKTYSDRLDCMHLLNESLGALRKQGSNLCDVTGSAVAVTALRPCHG